MITSLPKRLAGKGTGHEYEDWLVHNAPASAWNAVVSMAHKVKDNILLVMTVPVIVLQPTTPSNLAADPLHVLLKVPNALIIK